jgi:hypothetical protein
MTNLIFGSSFKGIEKGLTDWYRNPNDFQDMENRLHVCETLFGDFNAKLMVLLQDAADEETLLTQKKLTPDSPLRHGPQIGTNRKLVKWFKDYFEVDINGNNSKDCGIYYANAIWLIKKGSDISSPIYLQDKVLRACEPVLDATINNLKELKLILAFGKSAFLALKSKFNIQESWEDALANNLLIDVGERFKVGAINHPRASIASLLTQARIKNLLIESKIIQI